MNAITHSSLTKESEHEQIAISLAAITLLTRKKWLELTSYGLAGIGVALGLMAWLHF